MEPASPSSYAGRLPAVESFLTEEHMAVLKDLAEQPKTPPEDVDANELLQWNISFAHVGPGLFLPQFVKKVLYLLEQDALEGKGPFRRCHQQQQQRNNHATTTTRAQQQSHHTPQRCRSGSSSSPGRAGAASPCSSVRTEEEQEEDDDGFFHSSRPQYAHADVTVALVRWAIAAGVRARKDDIMACAANKTTGGGVVAATAKPTTSMLVSSAPSTAAATPQQASSPVLDESLVFPKVLSNIKNGPLSSPSPSAIAGSSSASHAASALPQAPAPSAAPAAVLTGVAITQQWDDNPSILHPSQIRLTTAALLAPTTLKKSTNQTMIVHDDDDGGESNTAAAATAAATQHQQHQARKRRKSSANPLFLQQEEQQQPQQQQQDHPRVEFISETKEGPYWEHDLRDYFIRWCDMTTALLAGSAKLVFFDENAASDLIEGKGGFSSMRGGSYMPYASTRVVKSLRRKATAAAKAALGTRKVRSSSSSNIKKKVSESGEEGDPATTGAGEEDDDEEDDNDDDEEDDEEEEMMMDDQKALQKRKRRDVEELHHGPVTAAVVAPKLNGIVTGSTDGTVKLWTRANGDFVKNLYCCSGRTSICGLAYARCSSLSDVVVIGTSTSHLALYSTLTGAVVKEYLGSSEKNSSDRVSRVPDIPLRPTVTSSRFRALPGTYGKRLIKFPPVSSATDSKAFFDSWRGAQEKEVLRTVPSAQIQNLSRLSILKTIQPAEVHHDVVSFGTADGAVGLLDLHDEFIDAITYGQHTGRRLASHGVVRTHHGTVTAIDYCRRHRSILSSAFDGTVVPRNLDTSQLLTPIGHQTKAITSMHWCEAQQMLATVTTDRRAYVWSFLGRRPIHEVSLDSHPVSVILHADKSQMAILCEDRQLLIFDTRTFRCMQGLSVVTDQAEREATIVVGGFDGGEANNNVMDADLSSKSTLAQAESSSDYISPYEATTAAGKAQHYGTLLSDRGDIIAVHKEVSVLKDALGKVSVRVQQGKVPVYGFRFDVYDDSLDNTREQQNEQARLKEQQQQLQQLQQLQQAAAAADPHNLIGGGGHQPAPHAASWGSMSAFSASASSSLAASTTSQHNHHHHSLQLAARRLISARRCGSGRIRRPVLKAPPVGLIYNKKNGAVIVADADGFLNIDVRTGEVIFCAASEKQLGQTTPSLATGGRLVSNTVGVSWCPSDIGKMRGIPYDSFLSLSKSGALTEWNAIDGSALRVTLPEAWASELGKGMKRPRRDKVFSCLSMCEKYTAVAQTTGVFVLNEIARRAPRPTALLGDDADVSDVIAAFSGNDAEEATAAGSKGDRKHSVVENGAEHHHHHHRNDNGETPKGAPRPHPPPSSSAAPADKTPNKKRPTPPALSPSSLSTAASAGRGGGGGDNDAEGSVSGSSSARKKMLSHRSGGAAESIAGAGAGRSLAPVPPPVKLVEAQSFVGHEAFSVECNDTVTSLHFSAGCEYLAIGTLRGLLHTVHIESSEKIFMTLSLLRAGEPTSSVVGISWNNHVGDCTVFAALSLGRIAAIHAPTRRVMLSLSVDLGPAYAGISLTSVHVMRHQSRGGNALEVLVFGDSAGVVRVATLQVKKKGQLLAEQQQQQAAEGGGSGDTSHNSHDQQQSPMTMLMNERMGSFYGNKASSSSSPSQPPDRPSSCTSGRATADGVGRRKSSFTFQELRHNESTGHIEWSSPIECEVLPEHDHQLRHLKSLKGMLDIPESAGDWGGAGAGADGDQRVDFEINDWTSSESESDSDDDQTVVLRAFSDSKSSVTSTTSPPDSKQRRLSTATNAAQTKTSGVIAAHQTDAFKKHQAAKLLRRANIIADEDARIADRAHAKLRGAFSKRRKGYIFEDIYAFMDPGNRKDPKLEKPVWTGCIDGVLQLPGSVGAVSMVHFLALKRLGTAKGSALIAAATSDGNVSVLRWGRTHDDEPSSLVMLTQLRCPISMKSRGPFWKESTVSLQQKIESREEEDRKAAAAAAGASSSEGASGDTFFLTQQQQQQQQQQPQQDANTSSPPDLLRTLRRDQSAVFANFVGGEPKHASSAAIAKTPSCASASGSTSLRLARQPSAVCFSDGTAPRKRAASTVSLPADSGQRGGGGDNTNITGAAATAAAAASAEIKKKFEKEEETLESFKPQGILWSPLGTTGEVLDETNMIYCLDDRWEQCDEQELKPRPLAGMSKARRKSIRRQSTVMFKEVQQQQKLQQQGEDKQETARETTDDERTPSSRRQQQHQHHDEEAQSAQSVGSIEQIENEKNLGSFVLPAGLKKKATTHPTPPQYHATPPPLHQQQQREQDTEEQGEREQLSHKNKEDSQTFGQFVVTEDNDDHHRQISDDDILRGVTEPPLVPSMPSTPSAAALTPETSGLYPDSSSSPSLVVSKKPDAEVLRQQFERLRCLRPKLLQTEAHPALDAIAIKQEAVEDVRRDTQRRVEKELMPSWLDAMRSSGKPMSVASVHMMSRPPPILLKHHKRV